MQQSAPVYLPLARHPDASSWKDSMMIVRKPSPVRRLALLAGLLCLVLSAVACGEDESTDPYTIGDAPVVAVHLDQADIDSGDVELEELVRRGEALFVAAFNTLDGAGRPETTGTGGPRERFDLPQNFNRISGPDSNACSGCHNLPRPGGGGDNVANVFVLGQRLPFVNFDGGMGDGSQPQTLEGVANERNTLGMFGSGYIELLAREMTADLHSIRDDAVKEARDSGAPVTAELVTKGVSFGAVTADPDGSVDTGEIGGVDSDLIIKPFHQKGVVVSLRQFTNNAMNHHHGMQASERFGDGVDSDADGIVDELTRGDMTAITVFQATLPAPGRVLPASEKARQAMDRGEEIFSEIGCAVCHVPELRLNDPVFTEPNTYNPPRNMQVADVPHPYAVDLTTEGPGPYLERQEDGSVLVPAFTDLKRHDMGDALDNEQLVQADVPTNEWLTRKLWGMASEPPFLHNGRATLISEAVLLHGGEAQAARDAFAALSYEDQSAVVEFLKCLRVLPPGADELQIIVRGP